MQSIQHSTGRTLFSFGAEGIERRIFLAMALTTLLATVGSVAFYPWRVTAGLLFGGLLALLNHYWLNNSSKAALAVVAHGVKPRLSLLQFVLRYAVVGAAVFIAYQFNLVSLPAAIVGLCSFVVALFIEALREVYFVIIHREEIS